MPWTVQRVLEQVDSIGVFDSKEILRALRCEEATLAVALRDTLRDRSGQARLAAAALLLLLSDSSGREPFLEALAGPDGDERNWAIEFVEYCVFPHDIEIRDSLVSCPIPISSDDLFAALKRDLHEPWTGLNRRILDIVARQDYPQARSITRPLLTHCDTSLRREIADTYLRGGHDEGAFAVVEDLLRSAPDHIPHRDPRWNDFYHVKGLWYSLEMAAERGDLELRNKVASLVMTLVTPALDAPNVEQRFDTNDGLIRAASAAKVLAVVMPSGAKGLLERLIACDAIYEFDRGETLVTYARALGDEARHFVLSQLGNPDLREYAARAVEPLVKDKNDPHDIAALSDALTNEERPCVVGAIGKALLAAGPASRAAINAVLDRCEPWTRVELSWRLNGGTDRELADVLTEAGVMDPMSDEQLVEALSKGFDVRSLIWAGGERLVVFHLKSSTGLEHFELFRGLLKVARPVIAVDDLKETCNANLMREPIASMPNVEKVTDLGTVCTVGFRYQGQAFSFEASPQGRWHDVGAVMKGFDTFMQTIGRDDRCYELEGGGGEYAIFVVAPAPRFEPVAVRLGIPLESDSQSARDAAKAFQKKIQDSESDC